MKISLQRIGQGIAFLCILLVLIYIDAVIATAASGTGFPPEDLYATIIALVTLISAPLIVFLWAIMNELTPASSRVWTRTSLSLIIIFATLTSINRYVQITVVRPSLAAGQTEGLEWFLPYGNPSVMASLEQLAWGFFFGLALIALAPAFGRHKLILWTLLISGTFSLCAIIGQLINISALTFVGVMAWGPGFLVLLILLERWFNEPKSDIEKPG
jgi:hypothetical protein